MLGVAENEAVRKDKPTVQESKVRTAGAKGCRGEGMALGKSTDTTLMASSKKECK